MNHAPRRDDHAFEMLLKQSGLPVIRPPEWQAVHFGRKFQTDITFLGNHIMIGRPSGYATLQDTIQGTNLGYEAIRQCVPEGLPYVVIEDFKNMSGASLDSRKSYIKDLTSRPNVLAFIFCHTTALFNISIKLAKKIYNLKPEIYIAENLAEALRLAENIVSKEDPALLEHIVSDEIKVCRDTSIEKIWKLSLDGYSMHFERINDNILHAVTSGYLRTEHIDPTFELLEQAFDSMDLKDGEYSFVCDHKELLGATLKARRDYVYRFRTWHERHPVKKVIHYNTNWILRASINISKIKVPFDVFIADDLDAAITLVEKEKKSALQQSDSRKYDILNSSQKVDIQTYAEELIQMLSELNWESKSAEEISQNIDPAHPFSQVLEAISLIKMDMDQVLSEHKKVEKKLFESWERYKNILNSLEEGYYEVDLAGNFLFFNKSLSIMMGFPEADLAGMNYKKFAAREYHKIIYEKFNQVYRTRIPAKDLVLELLLEDGAARFLEMSIFCMLDAQSNPVGFRGTTRDITQKIKAKEGLHLFKNLVDNSTDAISIATPEGRHYYQNKAFDVLFGEIGDDPVKSVYVDNAIGKQVFDKTIEGGSWQGEIQAYKKDGSILDIFLRTFAIRNKDDCIISLAVLHNDITEQKQSEKEREKLQKQLYQSQKLDAIGILAGGVAHDFNNMLSGIMGYTELSIKEMDPSDPLQKNLYTILDITKRSASLTRQLLAFARKQTIEPIIFDLNEAIETILIMIRRIIGENIELSWLPKARSATVSMDPSQFDQIIVNLCVNAKDAISSTGRITIETDIVSFDEAYCSSHAYFTPGEYVLLAVSDNGCGMNKKTLNHIFEPFFTTKSLGQGTGMGLSTVYGIIKQNDGFINVYSEPGQGTTIKIYLPLNAGEAVDKKELTIEDIPYSQGETILIVEDEPVLLEMNSTMLQHLDYVVLSAGMPSEAIHIIQENSTKIHMVITDVVMPGMNGRELVDQLQGIQPEIKHLFMSGYTANIIAHQGVLEKGVNFIQKPFTLRSLAVKIREVLDSQK